MSEAVYALDMMTVAEVVEGLHGDNGVNRVCDLRGLALFVGIGAEEGDAIAIGE